MAEGIGFGPRLLMTVPALRESGLIQPGSLVRWTYRIALPGGGPATMRCSRAVEDAIDEAAPEAGWRVRSRLKKKNADPQFQRNIERFAQFLTLVGLTALIVGGVGGGPMRCAVSSNRKRDSIATLKGLGRAGRAGGRNLSDAGDDNRRAGHPRRSRHRRRHPLRAAFLLARRTCRSPIAPVLAWSQLGIAALYGGLIALRLAILPAGRGA